MLMRKFFHFTLSKIYMFGTFYQELTTKALVTWESYDGKTKITKSRRVITIIKKAILIKTNCSNLSPDLVFLRWLPRCRWKTDFLTKYLLKLYFRIHSSLKSARIWNFDKIFQNVYKIIFCNTSGQGFVR